MAPDDSFATRFRLPSRRQHYYGGGWHRRGRAAAKCRSASPATGESLGVVERRRRRGRRARGRRGADGVPAWRDVPAQERAACIRKAAAALRNNAEELAWIDAMDTGNPFNAMLYDVEISAAYMDYFAGLVTEMKGATIPIGPNILNYTMREPLGVVARIGAFNHPLLFVAGKAGAPLAAGNTLIVKPADQTPLSALRIAELWEGILPPGVFNVVTGGRDAGAALVEHPGVAKIGFIGSVGAGRAVMQAAGKTLKALTLELGGKNALIACADAGIDEVADGVVRGMNFRYVTGQSCNSTSRVFLHEDIHDARARRDRQARLGAEAGAADRSRRRGRAACRARRSSTRRSTTSQGRGGRRAARAGRQAIEPTRASPAASSSSRRCSPT